MELSHGGLRLVVPDSVYPPAEDSFLLAGGAKRLRGRVLEVGCGSGIASLACAKASASNSVLGLDINPAAVRCARANARGNGIKNAEFRRGDLFRGLVKERFDAIMFNPPYLPTSGPERIEGPLNRAFDGGPDGRRVLDRFLSSFDRHLVPGGTLLLIQSSLNDKGKTVAALRSLGYRVRPVKEERFFFERLWLLRAVKPRF